MKGRRSEKKVGNPEVLRKTILDTKNVREGNVQTFKDAKWKGVHAQNVKICCGGKSKGRGCDVPERVTHHLESGVGGGERV